MCWQTVKSARLAMSGPKWYTCTFNEAVWAGHPSSVPRKLVDLYLSSPRVEDVWGISRVESAWGHYSVVVGGRVVWEIMKDSLKLWPAGSDSRYYAGICIDKLALGDEVFVDQDLLLTKLGSIPGVEAYAFVTHNEFVYTIMDVYRGILGLNGRDCLGGSGAFTSKTLCARADMVAAWIRTVTKKSSGEGVSLKEFDSVFGSNLVGEFARPAGPKLSGHISSVALAERAGHEKPSVKMRARVVKKPSKKVVTNATLNWYDEVMIDLNYPPPPAPAAAPANNPFGTMTVAEALAQGARRTAPAPTAPYPGDVAIAPRPRRTTLGGIAATTPVQVYVPNIALPTLNDLRARYGGIFEERDAEEEAANE